MISGWSDDEIRALAEGAYQGKPLRCPRCGARVAAREAGYMGRSSTPIDLRCERCGSSAEYSPDHLEEMKLEWTLKEKIQIVERYWASGYPRCPKDDSRLKVIKSKTIGPPPPDLHIRCPHCGRAFWSREIEDEREPDSFEAKYAILEPIGQGGMGQVDMVRDRASGDVFAAKRILPEFLRDVELIRRFNRESRILTAVSHPNVVSLKETFLDDAGGVIVMDYVKGGTLAAAINSNDASPEQRLSWFSGLVEGLRHLHAAGIVHRDLKPQNVLIDGTTAKIADFGLVLSGAS